MNYNIIGDIHGRTKWKDLVLPDAVNIFVGDYFSPYHHLPFKQQEQNFLDIVKYKEEYDDKVVLLVGNHDLEYFFTSEIYSRHDYANEREIENLFKEYPDAFEMAYSIEDKVLVTHAGVTKEWFEKALKWHGQKFNGKGASNIPMESMTPDIVANVINDLYNLGENRIFEFYFNAAHYDYCGESETQSCVWIRPWTLGIYNLFTNTSYKQVFGHTINRFIAGIDPKYHEENCLVDLTSDNINLFNLYMVDCLQYSNKSLIYDPEVGFSINSKE